MTHNSNNTNNNNTEGNNNMEEMNRIEKEWNDYYERSALEHANQELESRIRELEKELSDRQVTLDKVNAIGERNAHRLREALKTTRQLICDAREEDRNFVSDHREAIAQLVSFGMNDFTKTVSVRASWTVVLSVDAVVPDDYTEDDVDILMKEDIDDIMEGAFFDDPKVESDSFDLVVDCRSFNVHIEED
jgi:sugar-specific transcriptional regulator TrmB